MFPKCTRIVPYATRATHLVFFIVEFMHRSPVADRLLLSMNACVGDSIGCGGESIECGAVLNGCGGELMDRGEQDTWLAAYEVADGSTVRGKRRWWLIMLMACVLWLIVCVVAHAGHVVGDLRGC
jgi:hypothetical protein